MLVFSLNVTSAIAAVAFSSQASKAGTKQADTLASQLEGMIAHMHSGVKNFGGDAGASAGHT